MALGCVLGVGLILHFMSHNNNNTNETRVIFIKFVECELMKVRFCVVMATFWKILLEDFCLKMVYRLLRKQSSPL